MKFIGSGRILAFGIVKISYEVTRQGKEGIHFTYHELMCRVLRGITYEL